MKNGIMKITIVNYEDIMPDAANIGNVLFCIRINAPWLPGSKWKSHTFSASMLDGKSFFCRFPLNRQACAGRCKFMLAYRRPVGSIGFISAWISSRRYAQIVKPFSFDTAPVVGSDVLFASSNGQARGTVLQGPNFYGTIRVQPARAWHNPSSLFVSDFARCPIPCRIGFRTTILPPRCHFRIQCVLGYTTLLLTRYNVARNDHCSLCLTALYNFQPRFVCACLERHSFCILCAHSIVEQHNVLGLLLLELLGDALHVDCIKAIVSFCAGSVVKLGEQRVGTKRRWIDNGGGSNKRRRCC